MARKLLQGIVLAFTLLGVAVGIGIFRLEAYLDEPVQVATELEVAPGTTLRAALQHLQERGVIRNPSWVYAYARINEQTDIRTGAYRIIPQDTPRSVLEMLRRGQVKTESFTLAEGLNRWQVRDHLASTGWILANTFDALCDDTKFLQEHGIPGPNCEGYLFPETYTFARGVPAKVIFATLFATYKKAFAAATAKGRGPLNLNERELMTLASIVEKETGTPHERPRIACLFYNRLKAKPQWRLDTDPTVIYAATLVDPNFDGNLKRTHLRMEHPYNTYRITGLPPGPIANPGRAAMDAVVSPSTCKDFFFVSMNNGEHVFCPTLQCHEAAVQKWQVEYFRRK